MRLRPHLMFKNGTSTGLIVWLFFLIAFVGLGYPIPISILVGAIGGLSAGAIVFWWHSKDSPPPPEEEPEESQKGIRQLGIVEAQRQRKLREKKSPKGKAFSWPKLKLPGRRR